MTTTLANQQRRINLANVTEPGAVATGSRHSTPKCILSGKLSLRSRRYRSGFCNVVSSPHASDLKLGQRAHSSFVQAQHHRDALESRAIRKLNHKSESPLLSPPCEERQETYAI